MANDWQALVDLGFKRKKFGTGLEKDLVNGKITALQGPPPEWKIQFTVDVWIRYDFFSDCTKEALNEKICETKVKMLDFVNQLEEL